MEILASDQITLVDVTDAYSVMLSSEAYTFVGDSNGVAAGSSCTTEITAYCGETQCQSINVSSSDIKCPTGISATITGSETSKVTITFTTTATVSIACEASISISIDDVTVNKKFSFAVAKAGTNGTNGTDGKPGAKGKDAAIISSTEPSDKSYLWCDTSVSPPLLKRWADTEWVVVNDNALQITEIYNEMTSSINKASDNIMLQVGEKTYSKDEVDKLLAETNTTFEQTKDSFTFEFNRIQSAINDVSNTSDARYEDITKYIRFVDGEIHIGIVGNPIMLRQRNDRISFLENNTEVAYISNRTLYFTHAEVLKDLKIGKFAWVATDSGFLALKLV